MADYLRDTRRLKVGVVNRDHVPARSPATCSATMLKGAQGRGGARAHRPAAGRRPAADARECAPRVSKCLENGLPAASGEPPYPGLRHLQPTGDMPRLYSGCYGLGCRDLQPEALIGAVENMLPGRHDSASSSTCRSISCATSRLAEGRDLHQQDCRMPIRASANWRVRGSENPNLMPKGAITVRMHSVGGWGAITTGKNLAVTLFDLLGYDIKANPEVRLGEEGPADHLLPVGRAGADPRQLRVRASSTWCCRRTRTCSATANPLSGPEEGRRVHHPEQPRRRDAVWHSFPLVGAASSSSTTTSACSISTPSRSPAKRPAIAELQLRMQGIAFQGAFFAASPAIVQQRRLRRGDGCSRRSTTQLQPSSAARASAWSRTTCAWCGAASTRCARSPTRP
ncbi:MAG: hypothetical protein MZV65_17725 [Chromatiales bacterium]|nr:hypothetical protein [Chromatiales bacterium]